jgi:phage antirepressor YoqD-like protein
MNVMTKTAGAQTMSSREIAELVESRHDSVKRAMERLAEKELISFTPLVETSHDGAGARPVEVYRVGKRDSYVIVAQLSPEFTARLVDRWQELESQVIDPRKALSDPSALRALLLENVEKVIALEGEIEEMRPQVQALERIAISEGSLCITDAAKTLQVQPKALFQFLDAHGWIYTRQGDNTRIAYQAKLQAGLLEHKTTVVTRSDGSEKTTTQVRVTSKGLARLAKEFPPSVQAA